MRNLPPVTAALHRTSGRAVEAQILLPLIREAFYFKLLLQIQITETTYTGRRAELKIV
jgi:hypothetical protein